eukprot:gene16926-19334_t
MSETPCDQITRALEIEKDSGLFPQAATLNQRLKGLSETERQIVLHVLLLNHTVNTNSTKERNRIIQEAENELNQGIVRDENNRPYNQPHLDKAARPFIRDQSRKKHTNHR